MTRKPSQRVLFERWAKREGAALERFYNRYEYFITQAAWDGWQASARSCLRANRKRGVK